MPEKNSTAQSNQKSSEKYNPPKVSHWEEVRFHCSVEWHFTWMVSRFAFTLYSWGRGLSFKTESFYPSLDNIAGYFGCERTTVFRALKELVRHGWAEIIHKEHGKPVVYRFVSHEEWALAHPCCCLVKEELPWKDEGDPLGRQLHAISGGLAKFKVNQMTGLRKSGLPDDQIAAEFSAFLEQNPQKGKEWESVYYRFRKHLLRLAADLRKVADSKNSTSDQLHRSNPNQLHGCNTPSCTEATTPVAPVQPKYLKLESERDYEFEATIPALREPLISSTESDSSYKGGVAPSLKNPPPKKETSPHTRSGPTDKELAAKFMTQLAEVEKLITDCKEGTPRLQDLLVIKAAYKRKIAEYSREEGVTV